ncbi:MAG: hypothetical protein JSS66_06220 [Armatimonadetes bacterium]|nr:hypothetical protein [Armatimonadota bacterium]
MFDFTVHEDKTVTIQGLASGAVKEVYGAGKRWRLWHCGGAGYQSGRQWLYGESSHWIVDTANGKMLAWHNFPAGRTWRKAQAILVKLAERLNEAPDDEQHIRTLGRIKSFVDDHQYEHMDTSPLQRLEKAVLELLNPPSVLTNESSA